MQVVISYVVIVCHTLDAFQLCWFDPGADPDRLLEDGQKSKYSIKHSNIQVNHIITQSNVSMEATQVYSWIHPCIHWIYNICKLLTSEAIHQRVL